MGYLIDRQEALLDTEIVALIPVRRRRTRSRVMLRDGSLRDTLTRPATLRRRLSTRDRYEGARWPSEPSPNR